MIISIEIVFRNRIRTHPGNGSPYPSGLGLRRVPKSQDGTKKFLCLGCMAIFSILILFALFSFFFLPEFP